MFTSIIGLFTAGIFFFLSGLHFYWAFGGRWAMAAALPKNEKGERMMNPGFIASAVVGIGLLGFGLLFLIKMTYLQMTLPSWILNYALWGIAGIFFLRAVGDFRYAGLFKKVLDTDFAKADTKIYIPLCLFLGFAATLVQINC